MTAVIVVMRSQNDRQRRHQVQDCKHDTYVSPSMTCMLSLMLIHAKHIVLISWRWFGVCTLISQTLCMTGKHVSSGVCHAQAVRQHDRVAHLAIVNDTVEEGSSGEVLQGRGGRPVVQKVFWGQQY